MYQMLKELGFELTTSKLPQNCASPSELKGGLMMTETVDREPDRLFSCDRSPRSGFLTHPSQKIRRYWAFQPQSLTACWMLQLQGMCVQHQTWGSDGWPWHAVQTITENGKTTVCQVDANLVGASGLGDRFHQG
jgi:hypothetical protein